MLYTLKYIWQLPQNIIALLLEGILCKGAKRVNKIDDLQIIYCDVLSKPLVLGNYLFKPHFCIHKELLHEIIIHKRQSEILGPLYIPIIQIPAMIYNIIFKICNKCEITWNYYNFYTEKRLM